MASTTEGLQIGICATTAGAAAVDSIASLRRREKAGFDHIAFGDHVSFHNGLGFDGMIEATKVLAATDAIGAYCGVYLLPLRHPVTVARQLADISAFAPGRLTLGVGIGGEFRHEVELCGVDPKTRGRRMDECMTIVRALQSGEPFDFKGDFFDLKAAHIKPACEPRIPLIVGGRSDAGAARAGRLGDGWLGIWLSPRRYAEATARCDEAAAAAGRGEVEWRHAMQIWVGPGETEAEGRGHLARIMSAHYQVPYEQFEKYTPYGSPERIAEFCRQYIAAGCRTINFFPAHADDGYAVDACAEVRHLLLAGG
jgi:alkanesulfonate monooxygenase SsuD/methylene tetrahydromethanopterin reductase-like flavin-dependent oxidoreductase (luciferase family)